MMLWCFYSILVKLGLNIVIRGLKFSFCHLSPAVGYLCVTPQRIYSCAHVHLPLITLLRTATVHAFGCLCLCISSLSSLHLQVVFSFEGVVTFSGHLLHPLTSTSIWILSNKATSLSPSIKYYCKWYSASSRECKCVWSLGFYRHDSSCLLPPERFSKFLLQTRSVSVLLNCHMFSQKDPENENKRRRAAQTFVEEGQLNCAFALFFERESEMGWLWSFLEEKISTWRV